MLCHCHAIGRHSKEVVVVIPDPEPMIRMVTMLEQSADERGWDQAPILGTVADLGDEYRSHVFPMQPFHVDPGDPVGALMSIGEGMMRFSDQHRKLTVAMGVSDLPDLTAGVWFLFEAWGGVLGEIEYRACVLLDCAGRIHEAVRARGEDPEIRSHEPGEVVGWGDLLAGLRRMLLAIGTGMSTGMIDMEKVGAAGVARA